MLHIAIHALEDSIAMLPFLFVVYIFIEIIENGMGSALVHKLKGSKGAPAIAAVAGCVPQCGFSVIGSTLYNKRFISLGTLIALYLSTSDEAIPILISRPETFPAVLYVIGIKIVVALIAGYLIDFFIKRRADHQPQSPGQEENPSLAHQHQHAHQHDADMKISEDTKGCCGHSIHNKSQGWFKRYVLHPFIHTLRVFVFIYIITFLLGLGFHYLGQQTISRILMSGSIFQPFIVALIGLVPNCAASIAITQLYVAGGISFGAAIAGMCASAGLGLVILYRHNPIKHSLFVTGLLYGISVVVGLVIHLLL